MRARRFPGLATAALLAAACAGPEPPDYLHNRLDYASFTAAHPTVLEPNYLPFMADHLVVGGGPWPGAAAARHYLVLCRWEADAFPLSVYVEPPEVPEDLRDAQTRSPEAYVSAVLRALAIWEAALEGLVSFEPVARARDADVVLHLTAEAEGNHGDVEVLGATPLGGACRHEGGDPATGRFAVSFRVPELRIHVADRFGLLLPDQVEKIALHEVGHLLGMRGHSPIPADLMYRVVRDRLPRGELGAEDVNSFVTLYSLPSGTVYHRLAAAPPTPAPPGRPDGPPQLALAPHVDARLGFEIQLPQGWTSLETGLGVVAVDGVTWDYDVSLQITVREFESVGAYLERFGSWHLGRGRLLGSRTLGGRYPGVRYLLATPDDRAEELVVLESGDGRVVVALWDSPLESREAWKIWFEASLATLELRAPHGADVDRDYGGDE
jgi:predicted Zn-dependent protease